MFSLSAPRRLQTLMWSCLNRTLRSFIFGAGMRDIVDDAAVVALVMVVVVMLLLMIDDDLVMLGVVAAVMGNSLVVVG
jgi:hypothetical protein